MAISQGGGGLKKVSGRLGPKSRGISAEPRKITLGRKNSQSLEGSGKKKGRKVRHGH